MRPTQAYDAIVIGFGPVGATIAALLARAGHRIAVVERHSGVYPHPRAVHGDDDLLRTLQALGLADEMLASGGEIMHRMAFTGRNNRPLLDISMPESRPQGWPADWWLHQPTLEQRLRACAEQAGARVYAPATLHTLVREAQGWRCQIGEEYPELSARFILGCDGANSTVREYLHLGYRTLFPPQHWYVADGYAPEAHPEHMVHTQVCDPDQPLTFVPGARRHVRYEAMDCHPEKDYNLLLTNLLHQHRATVGRVQRYTFRAGVARVWQQEGVFLLGDAAHETPPFAGQGLCAGIRDAANLWWKLDAALRSPAAAYWPETYQPERQPHAIAWIRRAWMIGALVQTRHRLFRHVRDAVLRLVHGLPPLRRLVIGNMVDKPPAGKSLLLHPRLRLPFPQTRMTDGRLSDEVLGTGWAMVYLPEGETNTPPNLPEGIPCRMTALTPATDPLGELTRWMHRHRQKRVLIRPDKMIAPEGLTC